MKSYFDEREGNCTITLDETKEIDAYTKVIDLNKLNNVLSALSIMGKEVARIYLELNVYFDIDTKYYKRYDSEFIDKLYKKMNRIDRQEVTYKNNRLYVTLDDKEIVCPQSMHNMSSDYDKPELTLTIAYK